MSKKELRQLELERYFTLREAISHWKNYSVVEKLAYVQKSFDQINRYNSVRHGGNPNDTKFGFCTGLNCTGAYSNLRNSVVMPFVKCAYMLGPRTIDLVLRHEMRHRDQHTAHVGTLESFYTAKSYKHYEHGASPEENDADKSAYLDAMRANMTAVIKSPHKVEAARELFYSTKQFVIDRFQHLRDRIAYATKGRIVIGKDKDKNVAEKTVFNKDNPPLYYSLAQLSRLVRSSPNSFSTLDNYYKEEREGQLAKDSGLAIFREYREAMNPYHMSGAFFGTFNHSTHERICCLHDGARNAIHKYDRYDKRGVLKDISDMRYSFSNYTPREVMEARGQILSPAEEERIDAQIQMVTQTTTLQTELLPNEKILHPGEPPVSQQPGINMPQQHGSNVSPIGAHESTGIAPSVEPLAVEARGVAVETSEPMLEQ